MKFIHILILLIIVALQVKAQVPPQDKGQPPSTEPFLFVEEMPEFPGGQEGLMNYLSKNLRYPADARERGFEGKLLIRFVVDEKGNVINPELLKPADSSLAAEAMRVVKGMPKWKPGKQNGKTVKVYFTLPITFNLEDDPAGEVADSLKPLYYTTVERAPYFPGGVDSLVSFLKKNKIYPTDAAKQHITGKVFVMFTVNTDGTITDANVLRSLGWGCDEEALRLVNIMPRWVPGVQDGKVVAVYYVQAIPFLEEKK